MSIVIPFGIIFVNDDLALPSAENFLIKQLFITQTLDGYTFDANLASTNYLPTLKQFNQKVLVLRSYCEFANRNSNANWTVADVVIYVKNGLIFVEKNKFGPHGFTCKFEEVTWGKLLHKEKCTCECCHLYHV